MLELDQLFKNIYLWGENLFTQWGIPLFWLELLGMLIVAVIILAFMSLSVLFLVWWERKVSGHMQSRFGPMRTGWHGWLQTIIDAIKLILKEDTTPGTADKIGFLIAPIIVFVSAFMAYICIPFGKGLIVKDLNIGILYILAITTFTVIGLLTAGWCSNNKFSVLGGFRSAAQIISYEVPLTLSILGVVILSQTLSMQSIVNSQKHIWEWYIFRQPIGFLIYLVAAIAEINRVPFDIPEAEQELVAGFNVEYSGIKFAMFFFAEFANLFLVSAIATTLFLGGWNGPLLPSWIWFFIKSFFLVFVIMWFKWTFPRLRVDQLMGFAWKFLLPLAFINLILTGLFA
ncbi:MAG: NADH-quinone oxidoreductase subunit NuoH [candidate division Zixibacteria bacterium]|nr:NADH-quinone oxidoreductase subunit NuoH [candidate division Zixibacteria bacterium]